MKGTLKIFLSCSYFMCIKKVRLRKTKQLSQYKKKKNQFKLLTHSSSWFSVQYFFFLLCHIIKLPQLEYPHLLIKLISELIYLLSSSLPTFMWSVYPRKAGKNSGHSEENKAILFLKKILFLHSGRRFCHVMGMTHHKRVHVVKLPQLLMF